MRSANDVQAIRVVAPGPICAPLGHAGQAEILASTGGQPIS